MSDYTHLRYSRELKRTSDNGTVSPNIKYIEPHDEEVKEAITS